MKKCFVYILLFVTSVLFAPQAHAASNRRLDDLARRLVQASSRGEVKKIRALLRAGADANRPSGKPNDEHWPLLEALKHHHFGAADTLRSHGVSFSQTTKALYDVVSEPDLPALEYLLKSGVNPDDFTQGDYSPLTYCIATSFMDVSPSLKVRRLNALRILLRNGANPNLLDKMGSGAIHDAGKVANLSWLKILLEFGANPNLADKDGDTALILSLAPGTNLYVAIESDNPFDGTERRAVRLLLIEKGAGVNAKNKRGVAPIHLASAENFATAIGDLVAHGANVNERGFCGATPLHVAMRYGSFEAARKLIALGADTQLKDKAGRSILGYEHAQVVSTDWELGGHNNSEIVDKDYVQGGRAKIVALLKVKPPPTEEH